MQSDVWWRWRHALKVGSWPKLLVPLAFGQALGLLDTHRFDPLAGFYALAVTLGQLVFVVLLNDYGDQQIDALKRRLFPDGCSRKTLPDGILTPTVVGRVGVAAGVATFGLACVAALHLDRSLAPVWTAVGLLLLVAYTLPPLRLNYRGGGELIEALGVGVVLPAFSAYMQSGRPWPEAWLMLLGYAVASLSSAVASGLSDEVSDRIGGKRTVASLAGNYVARRAVELSLALGIAMWLVALFTLEIAQHGWLALPAAVTMISAYRELRRISPAATTNAFSAQAEYKAVLHRALWHGTLLMSVGLVVARMLAA